MTKLTTELLEKFVSDIKTDGMCDITDSQVESALIRLLAYEQAAKNPVAWVATDSEGCSEYNSHNEFSASCGAGTPLYAAPALPKQPELLSIGELLHRLEEQTGEKWVEASAQPAIPEQTERERIRREHAEWSDATFGNVGPVGPLKHLSKEALEAAAAPDDLLEWADMQFLLWDAQRRMGIPDDFITIAMIEKLEINKKRKWPKPKDGEPRLHINTQSAQPVSEPYKLNGWISVDEKMPEDGDAVLVHQDGGIIFCAEAEHGWFYPDEFPNIPKQGREITHWIPLPAAPTAQEQK